MNSEIKFVWVFNGNNASFPAGIFKTRKQADAWILDCKMTGVLTRYPVDVSAYHYAISAGLFKPKDESQRTPEFIGRFSSASFEHIHYENGKSLE